MILGKLIAFLLFIITVSVAIHLLYRNRKVYLFVKQVNTLIFELVKRNDYDVDLCSYYYSKIPTYYELVYSFTKLKLNSFYTKEEVEQLLNKK